MPLQPVTPFTPAGRLRPGQYYRHSGGLNPAGLAAAALAGIPAALVVGFAYAYADKYIPEVHLSALACLAAGAALGVVPAAVLRRMKVRHLPAALLLLALVGVAGLYASWATWEAILTRAGLANLRPLATHPADVARLAVKVNATGTWSIGSTGASSGTQSNTSGAFLWLIWAAEAATLVGLPLLIGKSMLASKPFCDACDRWCDGPTTVRTTGVPAGDAAEVRRRLEAGDFAYPLTLGPPTALARLTFARHGCDRCHKLDTLTVTSRTVRVNRKGKAQQAATKVLVNKLLVTPDDLARLTPPPAAVEKR